MIGHIYIYGQIGSQKNQDGIIEVKGVELIDVIASRQKQMLAESFEVHIKSDGGNCDVGYDIYNYLKSLDVPVKTIAEGRVASMASVIFMAGSVREFTVGSEIMIHFPWGTVSGTADDMQRYTDTLKAEQDKAVSFFCDTLGLSEEAVMPLLRDETFISDHELLLSLGIITGVKEENLVYAKYNQKEEMKNSKENLKKLNGLQMALNTIMKAVGIEPKALLVADSAGVMLSITQADGSELDSDPKEGDLVTVDGVAGEGMYDLPDYSKKIEVVAGVIVSVAANSDSTQTNLAEQLAQANAKLAEYEAKDLELTAKLDDLENKMRVFTMGKKEPVKAQASFRTTEKTEPTMAERKSTYKTKK